MNDQEKEKHLEKFRQNVQWLREQIPPDDIYEFAEQALMAADFFISELSSWVDLSMESEQDKVLALWLKNVVGMRVLRDQGYKGRIDMTMKPGDEI